MSASYTRELVEQIASELQAMFPESVVCGWDDDLSADISRKINALDLCILIGMPNGNAQGDPGDDDWRMTLQITIESNPVTKGRQTNSFLVAEQIMERLNNWSPETDVPRFPYRNLYASAVKHTRNGKNFIHTLTFTAKYGLR